MSEEGAGLPSTHEVLSEHVYAVVHDLVPEYADRVTGMLLECPVSEVMAVMSDKAVLRQRVTMAVAALRRSDNLIIRQAVLKSCYCLKLSSRESANQMP